MPDLRKRLRYQVQDGRAAAHERHMVVAHAAPAKLLRFLVRVDEYRRLGLGLGQPQTAKAALDGGELLVRPVGGQKVRGDRRVGGAEEVEEDEEGDLSEGVLEGGFGRVGCVFPFFG